MTSRILTVDSECMAVAVQEAADALRAGCLVIVPTDTVYGIAAHPACAAAVDSLYDAKERDGRKPIPLLAADVESVVRGGASLGAIERRLARRFWPGALTIVLSVGAVREGFRVPDHEVMRSLLSACGGLLRVTSANLSGQPPALDAREAVRSLGASASVVLDAGRVRGGTASTVVAVDGGAIQVLREGAISKTDLLTVAGSRDQA